MDDEQLRELEPYFHRLRMELDEIDWSPESLLGTMKAMADLRQHLGEQGLDALLWFMAAVTIRQRVPSAEEAAELGMPPEVREQLRALWEWGRSPSDPLH